MVAVNGNSEYGLAYEIYAYTGYKANSRYDDHIHQNYPRAVVINKDELLVDKCICPGMLQNKIRCEGT
ncbi:hypothetical protein KIM372_17590 [Bombiscardovia nodaiensis]|uniref:Uncharacterized protein n=1 Tax=Bombiscardovia nodaiensis TaxID=2932181 RepID=A0ABN6SF43_9BIFI|nr:hypothetical protein KIM372_17590 [Bombiscardovia nodaiensis]